MALTGKDRIWTAALLIVGAVVSAGRLGPRPFLLFSTELRAATSHHMHAWLHFTCTGMSQLNGHATTESFEL